jgi:protein TonB
MVIRQPINGAIFQSFADAAPRKRMSRGMSIAIGASIVAHVAVGIYLYNAAFSVPKPVADDDQVTTVDVFHRPSDPPPKPAQRTPPPPHPTLHQTPITPLTPLDHPLTVDPTPHHDPITLKDPPGTLADNGPTVIDTPKPKKITRPDWLSQPDAAAMSRYYPERAQRLGVSGSATINCTVAANGTISGCDVVSETPSNYGFGDAARKLSRFFKMRPQMVDGQPVAGGTIEIPIQFRLSDS